MCGAMEVEKMGIQNNRKMGQWTYGAMGIWGNGRMR